MNNHRNAAPVRLEVAIFPTRVAAESAVGELLASGFPASDISLFLQAPLDGETKAPASSPSQDAVEIGGEAGAGLGGAVGGVGGVLAGLGLMGIPGLGPVLAAGPLAVALTGAITGGALGGFTGSLIGEGVSEVEAKAAERQMKAGRTVVILRCAGPCEAALNILRAKGWVAAATDRPDAGETGA